MTARIALCVSVIVATASGAAEPAAEYGHGLTPETAREGWVSLFDGATSFGWEGASVERGTIGGGVATTALSAFALRADVVAGGEMVVGGRTVAAPVGGFERTIEGAEASPIRLGKGVRVRSLVVRPLRLEPLLSGDGGAYNVIPHGTLPPQGQAKWHPVHAAGGRLIGLRGEGGPGAAELPLRFGDFVLQLDVRTLRPGSNGGVFFRCVPGQYLNGYEAQVLNRCGNGDPAKPLGYSTGAIDDRQRARRLVSRDGELCTMTIVAKGSRLSTWVNGYQLTDWNDRREPHENPRQGLRREAGTIQFQSHDPQSEVEFRNVRAAEITPR